MTQPPDPTSPAAASFFVFVYGSLKQGEKNYEAFCAGFRSVRPATILGRLYVQTSGYPMLVIPGEHAFVRGTGDAKADVVTLRGWRHRITNLPPVAGEIWQTIHGEIFEFDDALTRLPHLDRLEDFRPGQASLYDRVIAPVQCDGRTELAWTYVAPDGKPPPGAQPIGNRWP